MLKIAVVSRIALIFCRPAFRIELMTCLLTEIHNNGRRDNVQRRNVCVAGAWQ